MISARVKRIKNGITVKADEWQDEFVSPEMNIINFSNFENKFISGKKSEVWFINLDNRYNYHISWLKNIDGAKK